MSITPEFSADLLKSLVGYKTISPSTTTRYLSLSTSLFADHPGTAGVVSAPDGELTDPGYERLLISDTGIWTAPDTSESGLFIENAESLSFGPFTENGADILSWFITSAPPGTAPTDASIKAWGVLNEPKQVVESLQVVWLPNSFRITAS